MRTPQDRHVSASEQAVLDGVKVRLIEPDEQERFDALIIEKHYLHNAQWVGRRLFYVAEYEGEWLALLAWTTAAFNLKDRDGWIGWTQAQRSRRLKLVVNNSRFLILDGAHYPNLASRVQSQCLKRLSEDWQHRYGHGLLLVESFVDKQMFQGTSYRVSGWQLLGETKGWGRSRQDFYVRHERPKQLWVRELRRGARELLQARALPASYASVEANTPPPCEASVDDLVATRKYFEQVPDWRSKQGDYNCAGLVALVACASLCGVQRGQRDLAAFARGLSTQQLKALGFRKHGRPRRYHPPAETTFYRFLCGVDSVALEQALLQWQDDRLGRRKADDNVLAVDGKVLRSSQGLEVVSVYACKSGRWLGSEMVTEGSNEIPAAQRLLARTDLENQRVTLDALHTQTETARIIVQEGGGDYLMTVKGNQPGIAADLQARRNSLRRAFSPSASGRSGAALRDQPQSSRGTKPVAFRCDS
jgi:hypothetical protein